MTDRGDPARLFEASPASLTRLAIREGRAELPDERRMDMLSLGLAGQLGGLGGGGDAGGSGPEPGSPPAGPADAMSKAATATAAKAGVAKVVGVVVVSGLLAGGWIASRSGPSNPPLAQNNAPATPAIVPSSSTVAPPPPINEADPNADPPPQASVVAPRGSSLRGSAAVVAPSATSSKRGLAPDGTTDEMRLLQHAQTSLASDPSGALAQCIEHEKRFPRGSFAEEREVLAIDALIRLGRRREAVARADAFFTRYPSSGHRPQVEALTAGSSRRE